MTTVSSSDMYLFKFTGQLLVIFTEQDYVSLIFLLVLGLKIFPLILTAENTHTHRVFIYHCISSKLIVQPF